MSNYISTFCRHMIDEWRPVIIRTFFEVMTTLVKHSGLYRNILGNTGMLSEELIASVHYSYYVTKDHWNMFEWHENILTFKHYYWQRIEYDVLIQYCTLCCIENVRTFGIYNKCERYATPSWIFTCLFFFFSSHPIVEVITYNSFECENIIRSQFTLCKTFQLCMPSTVLNESMTQNLARL